MTKTIKKRTILVCFDNGKWIQKNIEYDEYRHDKHGELDHMIISRYIENYKDKKNNHSLLNEVAPSIIHAVFLV